MERLSVGYSGKAGSQLSSMNTGRSSTRTTTRRAPTSNVPRSSGRPLCALARLCVGTCDTAAHRE